MATASTVSHKRRTPRAFSAFAETGHSYRAKYYKQVQKDAREKFTQEISFRSKDKDISPAKALLHVATEDEAFMAFNREMDAYSIQNETKSTSLSSESLESTYEVEAELISRETRRNLVEVLDAVNTVLFKSRGFKRSSVPMDSKCSYLHSVLSSGYCSAILLSVVYIEVCRRLNVTILGSRIGEDFLIWPQTRNPEELFKITSCHSLFGIVNGKCANDPRTKASDIDSSSLSGLEIATIRDIIGIALANLIRLHWKCASRSNHGLMLTSHLRSSGSFSKNDSSNVHLLRPQDLREYEEAVKELSICMAFAPEEESEILEVCGCTSSKLDIVEKNTKTRVFEAYVLEDILPV
ncbi:hypothetical protein T459_31126 [Capsicum annuum]|uniref:Protein SirB1 N-terminal domain-containing protein n=1 Tax=Capsicum annuum TaxID=4072 RepID=A0A2G2YAX3_CAPAN|nr:hypothetical protein T459_31126 [Capsicum annuum]